MTSLNNKFYFLSPVEVVKVTPKNLQEVAEWCGGKIAKVESRRIKGRVDSYVWVPTPKGSVLSWAFPGMYITKRLAVTEKNELKATYSVFRKDYFTKNYFSEISDAVDQTWERQAADRIKADKAARTITVVVPETLDPAVVAEEVGKLMQLNNENLEADTPIEDLTLPTTEAELMTSISSREELPDSIVEQRETLRENAVEADTA